MTRAIFGELLLFLLPFVVFALYLVVRRRNPLVIATWNEKIGWLVLAGLGCTIAALLYTGLTAERQSGGFTPTHVENGHVVPGRFQ
jgi:hypothetical protein